MNFPQIDRDQAQRQLELLGYQPNDPIYLRFFYASNDPRKENDRGRKQDRLNYQQIEQYQQQGRGVYFVINGGGHRNDDVTQGRAIFFEHDNLDKNNQKDLWRSLNLPEPTFQVDTGGKSIHSYWVFEKPIPVKEWCELQRDLLKYAQADQSIKNPARVMRLAGGWHLSCQEGQLEYRQSQMISDSGKTYDYDTLRSMIPQEEKKTERQGDGGTIFCPSPSLLVSSSPEKLPRHPDQISVPVSASVPLLECCRKEIREKVNLGVPKGSGRNSAAIEVGLELISVERHLQAINQPYNDTARQLFNDFCCRSGLSEKEKAERWDWCETKNPDPSCGEEGISACIRGWYWREVVKPQRSSASRPKAIGFNPKSPSQTPAPSCEFQLIEAIKAILAQYTSESQQIASLLQLAKDNDINYREIEKLVKTLRTEQEDGEQTRDILANLGTDLQTFHKRLNLTRYLESALAYPLIKAAIAMPTAPEYIFNTLLSVAGSLIGTKCRVIINPDGGYVQPCLFWSGNVVRSGQAKTPTQKMVISPLEEMEAEAYEVYQAEYTDYMQEKGGQPPKRKRYMMHNVTIAQKLRIHAENPNGLLEYIDELSSDFNRCNQYSRGKGDDLQQELMFFNGGATNYDRSDTRIFLSRTGFNKTGSFQWETLGKLMEDDVNFISSGYFARFLLCSILDAPDRRLDLFKDTSAVQEFQAVLRSLYQRLEQLEEQDYFLAYEAKQLFQAWNHQLIQAEKSETHQAFSLVYAKIESYTARIALWLHLVNAVMEGERPSGAISGQTMQSAIEIAQFYLGQQKLIHAHNSADRQLEGLFLKVQTQAQKMWDSSGAGVTASWLKSRLNALKKWGTDQIREKILKPLAAQGLGRVEGEGTKLVYIPGDSYQSSVISDSSILANENKETSSTIGTELMTPPIVENQSVTEELDLIGDLGDHDKSLNLVSPVDTTDETLRGNPLPHNTNKIQERTQELDSNPNYQNTNLGDSTLDGVKVTAIGEITNSTLNQLVNTNSQVQWLLNFLKEVEKVPMSGSRFTCYGQIQSLMSQVETKFNQYQAEVIKVCVDYENRLWQALETAIALLPHA